MDKRQVLFGLAAVALLALVVIDPTFAQASDAGGRAKSTLENVLTGNIGLMLGLGITVLGLWTWIIGQKTGAGIVMIIGGVLLTLAPGLFNGTRNMLGNVVQQFSGNSVTQVQNGTSFSN